ncbi:antibiotic biosynthesis monooxygenase [Vibrio hannami]|uniref:putative quinol monooxygenase n=1 Tax=Vibrio hannami TaxID=2717094 RepID=UPI00240EF341|nr:antibiotic biosynthesis monooxygenase [Vibrio hannami]MDG3085811.1 antibiotic biosynthesis monooxygenase [Vibrio hannami]
MFIAIYEFEVSPGEITAFRNAWLEVTKEIYKSNGSLGSRLHTTDTPNVLIGYAQWPDKSTWGNAPEIKTDNYQKNRAIMKECLISSRTIHQLDVIIDHLHQSTYVKTETEQAL